MQGELDYSLLRKHATSTKEELHNGEVSSSSTLVPESLSLKEDDSCIADTDYVGFANLPQQIYRTAMRRGFEFTVMVIGESGLGKSTFINNLFLSDIYGADYPGPSERIKKTIGIEQTKVLLIENGVKLYLTVVDLPGFGDSLNNSDCWIPIVRFIDERHQEYLESQHKYNRNFIDDTRVHCCLYFISPWGYGLKPLDIQVMKQLHEKVNLVPLIAKADIFTSEECQKFKQAVMKQIEENEIKIYDFPLHGNDDEINSLKNKFPLAVMGSLSMINSESKRGRGRKYPWGIAEVENIEHCDFTALRNLLIRAHMYNLMDDTNCRLYEDFRMKVMSESAAGESYLFKIQDEKRAHEMKLKNLSKEMEYVFDKKIDEKLQKLRESEAELEYRSQQMAEALQQERQDLEEKRMAFERVKTEHLKKKLF